MNAIVRIAGSVAVHIYHERKGAAAHIITVVAIELEHDEHGAVISLVN